MPVTMSALAVDLEAESAVLRAILADLDEEGWRRETPAVGWSIADQVSHLAWFDDAARRSAVDPDAFIADRDRLDADGGMDPDIVAARYRSRSGAELLAWLDEARAQVVRTLASLDARLRVPWYSTSMSAASLLTARIMETWAHGQDVADALGIVREPSARLRHVAHIGVGARAFSYALHGRPAPEAPVRVELTAPDGAVWTWGPEDAADRIAGPALDFALFVTQRRHRDDLELNVVGSAASDWLEIGQAFAGKRGTGRKPESTR